MAVGSHVAPSVGMKKGPAEISVWKGFPMQGQKQGNRKAGERRLARLHSICIRFLRRGDDKK